MPESTLSLQLADLAAEVGSYLGYRRTPSSWSGWQAAVPFVPSSPDTQLGQIMVCVQEGLRQFYFPKQIDQGPTAYKWSFLTPQRQLAIVAGQATYDLPDDFGGLEGEMTYQPNDSTWLTVKRMGVGQILRYLQQMKSMASKPQMCAIFPKQTDGVMGQRFQVMLAPVPDASYTLTYTMAVAPQALSATNPFPYGGVWHGSTIVEACLAVAELRFNDEPNGPHRQAFEERLTASITVDIRDFKPAYLGYNSDRSDMRDCGFSPWTDGYGWGGTPTVGATMNGQPF